MIGDSPEAQAGSSRDARREGAVRTAGALQQFARVMSFCAMAAVATGRSSVSVEIEPKYAALAEQRLREATWLPRSCGAVAARVVVDL